MTNSTGFSMICVLFTWLTMEQCGSQNGPQPQSQNKPCDCDGPTRKAESNIEAVVRPGLQEGFWLLYARGLNGGQDNRPYSLCDTLPVELRHEGLHIIIQDSELPTVACPDVRQASSSLKLNKYKLIKFN